MFKKEEIERRKQEVKNFAKEYMEICKKYNMACVDFENMGFSTPEILLNDGISNGFFHDNKKCFEWLKETMNSAVEYKIQFMDLKCEEIFDKNGNKLEEGDKVVMEGYSSVYVVSKNEKQWYFRYIDENGNLNEYKHNISPSRMVKVS